MNLQLLKIITILTFITFCQSQVVYPVAVFHGMGDSCSFAGMQQFTQSLSDGLRGQYVRCIESGSFIGSLDQNLNVQSENACKILKEDENLKGEISVVGLSQGGLIGRAMIEGCDFGGVVKRFISIAGPQMGVATIPNCFKGFLCNQINNVVRKLVYKPYIQDTFGPANMFNNAKNQEAYVEGNIFLPNLNNQGSKVNESYKSNFEQLEILLLTMFEDDTMVNPPSSAWFSFWDQKMKKVIPMEEQPIYTENLIGLKTLDQNNQIEFLKLPGNHLQFTQQDIEEYFIPTLAGLPINTNKKGLDQQKKDEREGPYYSDNLNQFEFF